ncbi:hypothetical protein YTPLAS21_19400 [Candidatus Nitrosocosmicus sp.]|nr:hypothetical protein YTPLAS21_19400 [Candidatus Nitrosocosmicus sp.]
MSDLHLDDEKYTSHNWKIVGGAQFVSRAKDKYSEWKCLECDCHFLHYYDLEPNIRNAMKQQNVAEKCFKKVKNERYL